MRPEIVVCDASFIGLRTVLPAAMALAKPRATLAALIKPQFEAGREYVGKGGVVRDPKIHQRVCEDIRTWLDGLEDWSVVGVTESPIKGPKAISNF